MLHDINTKINPKTTSKRCGIQKCSRLLDFTEIDLSKSDFWTQFTIV